MSIVGGVGGGSSLSLFLGRFFRRFGRSLFSVSVSLFLSSREVKEKCDWSGGRVIARVHEKRELINPKNAMVDASQGRARGRSTEKPAGKTRRRGTRWKERAFFARTVASRDDEGELFASGRERFFAPLFWACREHQSAAKKASKRGRDFCPIDRKLRGSPSPPKYTTPLSLRALENTNTNADRMCAFSSAQTHETLTTHPLLLPRHVWRRRLR